MKTQSKVFVLENETLWENVGNGIDRQILGYDGQLMLVKVRFKNSKTVINFINTNDINRIKRYFPSNKSLWSSINFEKIMKRIEFDSFLRMNILYIY